MKSPEKLLGSTLNGKYRLNSILGKGGMGVVFDAENVSIGRRVAIKTLLPKFSADIDILKRLEREARAATEIGNPHIVEILDFDKTPENLHFIIMEHVDGTALSSILEEMGPIDPERAIDIAGQTLYALSSAHQAGIIHRDIKPENLMICKRTEVSWKGRIKEKGMEGRDFVKILDFGISRFIKPATKEAKLTVTGSILGSPYYMSPEQASGTGKADQRSDVYSVGVVMYHMLSGKTPFDEREDDGIIDVLYRVRHKKLPSLGEINPTLPYGLVSAVEKAMEKDPDRRFQDTDAFIDAIKHFSGFSFSGEFDRGEAAKKVKRIETPVIAEIPVKKPDEKERPKASPSTLPAFQEKEKEKKEPEQPAAAPEKPQTAPVDLVQKKAKTLAGSKTANTFATTLIKKIGARKRVTTAFLLIAVIVVAGIYLLQRGGGKMDEIYDGIKEKETTTAPAAVTGARKEKETAPPLTSIPIPEPEQNREERKQPATPEPSEPAAEPEITTLKFIIDSEPEGAFVILDKTVIGITPFEREMDADGKKRLLKVQLEGYRPRKKKVVFSAKEKEIKFFAKLSKNAYGKSSASESKPAPPAKTVEKTTEEKTKPKKEKKSEIMRDLDI